MRPRALLSLVLISQTPVGLLACASSDDAATAVRRETQATAAALAAATYADAHATATALHGALQQLVATPTQAALDEARARWVEARAPYLRSEMLRYWGGPIDDARDLEDTLNAWPLDEAYLDYVVGAPNAGLIQDPTFEISQQTLRDANMTGAETNISVGYHALEFLLWGQDLSADAPGQRPASDYDPAVDAHAQRRGAYLTIAGGLLRDTLGAISADWTPGSAFRADFDARDPDRVLRDLLIGMMLLSELETGGERVQPGLDSGDQEDEHSCFSDMTHLDMIGDVEGIANLWTGRYVRVSGEVLTGTGVRDAVRQHDEALADAIDAALAAARQAATDVQPPWDQEIAFGNPEGRARVQALRDALYQLSVALEDALTALNITNQPTT